MLHPRQKFAKRMWFLGFFHGNKKCWASENTVVLDHPVNICRTFKHFSCIVESHVSYSRLLHCLPVLKLAGQSKLVPVYLPSCLFQGFQLFDFPYIAFPMLTIVQAWFFFADIWSPLLVVVDIHLVTYCSVQVLEMREYYQIGSCLISSVIKIVPHETFAHKKIISSGINISL